MKILALICLATIGTRSMAQSSAARPPVAMSSHGAFWALSVADVNSMSQWYAEKFGLRVTLDAPRANGAKAIVLEGDGLIVELIQHDGAKPRATPDAVLVHGIMKAGIIVDDFDKAVASLRATNVPFAFGPFPARAGQRANAIIRDPEGNLIQIFGR